VVLAAESERSGPADPAGAGDQVGGQTQELRGAARGARKDGLLGRRFATTDLLSCRMLAQWHQLIPSRFASGPPTWRSGGERTV